MRLKITSKSFFISFKLLTCCLKSLLALSSLEADKELQLESISLVFSKRCNLKKIRKNMRRKKHNRMFNFLHSFLSSYHRFNILLIDQACQTLDKYFGGLIIGINATLHFSVNFFSRLIFSHFKGWVEISFKAFKGFYPTSILLLF